MLLIPAIDLKDGQCVRLRQGDLNDTTIFSDNPSTVAEAWLKKGAERLHLVDLNGAFAGRPKNQAAIEDILATIDREIPVQIGGGIRDMATIEHYLDSGIDYVINGTAAVKAPGFFPAACSAFSGHIIVGLDAKDGKVATDGWAKVTKNDVIEMAKRFEDFGVESIIYTDIGRDGMLTGVNVEATVRLAQATRIPVIASGGVTDISDIEALCNVSDEGIEGVILGRSIYEGTLDFEAALDYVDDYFEEAEE